LAVFARSLSLSVEPSMIDNGIAHVRDTVMPALSHIDGYLGLSLMVDRTVGRGIVTTAWQSKDAMRKSVDRAMAIRDEAVRAVGASSAGVEEWEVAVMHRAHHAREGTAMRATWVGLVDSDIDDAIETFKQGTLAKIEDLPGFCSASLLVNRDVGRAVTTVAYDDRSSLEYSREGADAVRNQAARQIDAQVLEVAEFELALAHLHLPEMV
jgi:heme-degrading monooxygenase HmoA